MIKFTGWRINRQNPVKKNLAQGVNHIIKGLFIIAWNAIPKQF